ncbi:hypothetical protein AB832_00060 [Flavobacteriaceae bacterium (ex Bugula neritina AB1)]|nr:hypothetical protein AB832_00060 [Flavobacteriaceae bacterium (ex Bugula neritina AB1)]
MTLEQDDSQYQFFITVLELLHINREDFFKGLSANSRYETFLHTWIQHMFTKQKTKEETVQFIYRVRRRCYINAIHPTDDA